MKIFDLLKMKYADWENQVKSYLSKTLGQDYDTNYGNSTIFGQLINVINGSVQNIMSYIEDSITEKNKYTAQRKKSIYGLAAITGYNPSLGKSSSCNIKINFKPSTYNTDGIIINNNTKLQLNQNGLIYNIKLSQEAIVYSLDKDNSSKVIPVVEGTYQTQRFYSTGGQLYTKNIPFIGDTDLDYLEVRVNNKLWERCDSFYDMLPNSSQYVAKTSIIKGFDLVFGNDEFGKSLKSGDVVDVKYLLHNGELGNINPNDVVKFTFIEPLLDIYGNEVDGNEIFNVLLVDKDSANSGTYSETTAQVREMIGFNSRSLVLADPKNYKSLLSRFSFVGYNRTWSNEGSLIINSLIMKNYKQSMESGLDYFNLKDGDFKLNDEQKDTIVRYISNSGQTLAGTTYKIIDPTLAKYACYCYVTLKNQSADQTIIENKIRNIVGEFFSDIYNDQFIPKSDLVYIIKGEISEIDGVNIYFVSERNETAITTGSYVKNIYMYNPTKGNYIYRTETVGVERGTNPNLGLDSHGNIYLDEDGLYPVLLGGWSYGVDSATETKTTITNPLIIVFE